MLSIPHCGENMFFLWSEMLLSWKEKDCQGGNVKATAICGGRTTWLGDKNCPLCAYVFKSLRQHNIICSRGAFRGPSIHPTQSQKLIAVEYLSLLPVYNRLWAFKPVYTEAFKGSQLHSVAPQLTRLQACYMRVFLSIGFQLDWSKMEVYTQWPLANI